MTKRVTLTREALRSGEVARRLYAQRPHAHAFLSDEERQRSLASVLEVIEQDEDVWVFGYGSLIWNPAFHYDASCVSTVYGFHRSFCLWTFLGRGSEENPGLVLGLEAGGSCRGVMFRVPSQYVASELDVLWRREMLSGAYRPVWVDARTKDGEVRALTFAINRDHERYAGRLQRDVVVRAIATAQGPLGPCAEYLFETASHLEALGIGDRTLSALARHVRAAMR